MELTMMKVKCTLAANDACYMEFQPTVPPRYQTISEAMISASKQQIRESEALLDSLRETMRIVQKHGHHALVYDK